MRKTTNGNSRKQRKKQRKNDIYKENKKFKKWSKILKKALQWYCQRQKMQMWNFRPFDKNCEWCGSSNKQISLDGGYLEGRFIPVLWRINNIR